MVQNNKKIALFFSILVIVVLGIMVIYVSNFLLDLIPDQKVAIEIAGRLQTTPSWDAIERIYFITSSNPA